MRDVLITILVFGSLPLIFWRPYMGVLVWSWLSYMNPHRLAWGFAYDMPFAQIVAICLLLSTLFTRERSALPATSTMFFWVLFVIWMCVTTLFAIFPEFAQPALVRVLKIQLITFLTIILIIDQKKLDHLIWIIVLSIGYYSAKGGLFTLLTGGGYRVWGPKDSFITENNGLALATLMTIPLMLYLYSICKGERAKRLFLGAVIFLSTVSVLGSQSRGALLSIITVAGFYWLKTKNKLFSGLGIILLGLMVFSFMPESWHERMSSIDEYEEDASAMGRINAWQYSINVANDRLVGAGFESWHYKTFAVYAPDPTDVHAAHSIYFSALADHGWPGMILFILVLGLTWITLRKILVYTANVEELKDTNMLARMIQVSLIAYMSGGAFLSLTYFDLPWHLIAFGVILGTFIVKHRKNAQDFPPERTAPSEVT
jgi:probable O-glycosylation ligase (exosortase A-associated)